MDRLPENKLPALRVMAMPADANQNGDIFGGWIMSHVDIAGGILAGRTARGRVATVAVKEFIFKQPVQVGDVVSFYADLLRIGNTSITVSVEVYAERRPSDPKVVKVTQATLTYVAIDRDGRPRSVPLRRLLRRRAAVLRAPGLAAGAAVFGFSSGIATGTGVIQVSLLLSAGLTGPAVLATDALSTIVLDLCKAALFQRFDLLDAEAAATGAVIGFATLPGSALAAWLSTRIGAKLHVLFMETLILLGGASMLWHAWR